MKISNETAMKLAKTHGLDITVVQCLAECSDNMFELNAECSDIGFEDDL